MKKIFFGLLCLLTFSSAQAGYESYYCYCAESSQGYAPYLVRTDESGNYEMTRIDPFDYTTVYECQYALIQEPLCH